MKQAVAKQGIEVVLESSFFENKLAEESSAYVMAFKKKHKEEPIDAVFLFGNVDLPRHVISEFYRRGIGDTVFLLGDYADGLDFWKGIRELQGDLHQAIQVDAPVLFQANNVSVQYFIDKFRHEYGQIPDTMAALGYDAVNILLAAIKQAGSSDAQKVAGELRYMHSCQGLIGMH
ncbi:MAG: hypothetical protein D3908_12290, partial [Candidatus Electrothrix sp. AUS4]|nr:hypothetical protein [Candidatus Electrothrix sp. AUS4]